MTVPVHLRGQREQESMEAGYEVSFHNVKHGLNATVSNLSSHPCIALLLSDTLFFWQ